MHCGVLQVRAFSLQLNWPLVPNSAVSSRCFLGHVGRTSVEIGFALSENDGEDLGTGSCILVFVDTNRVPTETPGRQRLLNLLESSSLVVVNERERQRLRTQSLVGSLVHEAVPPPPVYASVIVFTPTDMDSAGVHYSAVIRRALDVLYEAMLEGTHAHSLQHTTSALLPYVLPPRLAVNVDCCSVETCYLACRRKSVASAAMFHAQGLLVLEAV
jgi:acyl-CoA thioesterase FadM